MQSYRTRRDHPRGCGEHKSLVVRMAWNPGSSPRMRGARLSRRWVTSHPGIIPADAGSTQFLRVLYARPWDHPRGCGEHLSGVSLVVMPVGSSPRMRGALLSPASLSAASRIIPADAGSTQVTKIVATRP